jgi:hypothetical protein
VDRLLDPKSGVMQLSLQRAAAMVGRRGSIDLLQAGIHGGLASNLC